MIKNITLEFEEDEIQHLAYVICRSFLHEQTDRFLLKDLQKMDLATCNRYSKGTLFFTDDLLKAKIIFSFYAEDFNPILLSENGGDWCIAVDKEFH